VNLLITGADGELGREVSRHLAERHKLRLTGRSGPPDDTRERLGYRQADLRHEDAVQDLVNGIDAIVHLAAFDPPSWDGNDAEQRVLEYATLGTYVLCQQARAAAVDRTGVVGSLLIFDAYPDGHLIDETWKPRPAPEAAGLAPYLCEQVAREFPREGGINGVCLRFLPIGDDPEQNTRLDDALHAIDCALALQFRVPGYRWCVFHVASSPRYLMHDAIRELGFRPRGQR
jgi:nucleoside-diphosphate-sugar epimerase